MYKQLFCFQDLESPDVFETSSLPEDDQADLEEVICIQQWQPGWGRLEMYKNSRINLCYKRFMYMYIKPRRLDL